MTSSVAYGAKVGEEITVSCPDLGDRKFLCQTGNTWAPPDVAGACLGKTRETRLNGNYRYCSIVRLSSLQKYLFR